MNNDDDNLNDNNGIQINTQNNINCNGVNRNGNIKYKNIINQHTIIDGGNATFDLNKMNIHIDIDVLYKNNTQKDDAIELYTKAIHQISQYDNNVYNAIEGVIKLRTYNMVHYYLPYKYDKKVYNNKEKKLRIKLFEERKWNELWDRIIVEQNKRTNKDKRRVQRKKYTKDNK